MMGLIASPHQPRNPSLRIDQCEMTMNQGRYAANDVTRIVPLPGASRSRQVPVMPGTLLSLELLLGQRCLDLHRVSRTICHDPGALLHLFAVAAEECMPPEAVPERVEDCIANLPFERLLGRLVGAGSPPREGTALAGFALHAVVISRYAQQAAEAFHLTAERALLVGMLHELGDLPWVLGWQSMPSTPREAASWCHRLTAHYHVPEWLGEALADLHSNAPASLWAAVVSAAHELAERYVNSA